MNSKGESIPLSSKGFCRNDILAFLETNGQNNFVVQLLSPYPALCNPRDCSMPGFLVLYSSWSLLKLTSTESVMPSNHLILWIPFSSCPQSSPASGSFPVSQLFPSSGQSIGALASISVLPMNIQGWFPLGWNGWSSLQSKGLSRVISSTTVQKHQFFSA